MFILGLFIGAFIGFILNGLLAQNRTSEPHSEVIQDSDTNIPKGATECQISGSYYCIGTEKFKGNPMLCSSSMVKE